MKTESQLQQDVQAELKWEPSVDAAHLGVTVKDGIVTLSGHVASYAEKWQAEKAAQRVAGVNGLAVEIEVKLAGSSQRDDADIARSVDNVLQWSSFTPTKSIQVLVEKGWVTLSGQVRWEFERLSAASVIRHLLGVTGVSNQITLKQEPSSTVVKADIEAALKRRAQNDAARISVEVSGSKVTLSGTAHNWAERDLASQAAWSAPGVDDVVDNIVVTY
jgi:osmotically-inducible protein OsmY